MNETLTLKELLAVIVRRGRTAVIFLVLLAFCFGGYRAASLYSGYREEQDVNPITAAQEEVIYRREYAEYEQEKKSLENSINSAKLSLAGQLEYNSKSLTMKVNPYSEWVTSTLLTVTNLRQSGANVLYPVSQIEQQYVLFFYGIDLQSALPDYAGGVVEDQYIRELITLEVGEGGFLLLKTIGVSEEDSIKLSESLLSYFIESNDVIASATCPHKLSIVSSSTKTAIDKDLIEKQEKALSAPEKYKKDIVALTSQLEGLKKPVLGKSVSYISLRDIVRSGIKYAALGAFFGLFLDVLLVLIFYMFSGKVEFSSHIGNLFSFPLLGSTEKRGSVWNRAAARLAGERIWRNREEAKAYLGQTADVLLDTPESIAILSTVDLCGDDPSVTDLIDALKKDGRTIRFVPLSLKNPETAAAIRQCDKVILAERKGVSKFSEINAVVEMAKAIHNPVAAYIMV